MSHNERIHYMFQFTFEKSSEEIKSLARTKIEKLESKIKERQARIAKIREEYQIADAVLIDLLTQARQKENAMTLSYSSMANSPIGAGRDARDGAPRNDEPIVVGAGVVKNILVETDTLSLERDQVKRLGLMVRNLRDLPDTTITSGERPLRGHHLSYEELEFLGC